jgi:hypothetical protein
MLNLVTVAELAVCLVHNLMLTSSVLLVMRLGLVLDHAAGASEPTEIDGKRLMLQACAHWSWKRVLQSRTLSALLSASCTSCRAKATRS